jgi:hypothetical protein
MSTEELAALKRRILNATRTEMRIRSFNEARANPPEDKTTALLREIQRLIDQHLGESR